MLISSTCPSCKVSPSIYSCKTVDSITVPTLPRGSSPPSQLFLGGYASNTMPHDMPLKGAEKLLRHLKRHHIPMCLATSSHKRHYELKTARHAELFALFEHRVTGCPQASSLQRPAVLAHDDVVVEIEGRHRLQCSLPAGDQVSRGKPAPDIFQRAASLFRPEPEAARCLVFEDAPSGVQAAKNAGM